MTVDQEKRMKFIIFLIASIYSRPIDTGFVSALAASAAACSYLCQNTAFFKAPCVSYCNNWVNIESRSQAQPLIRCGIFNDKRCLDNDVWRPIVPEALPEIIVPKVTIEDEKCVDDCLVNRDHIQELNKENN